MSCQSRKLHPGNCVSQTNQKPSETVLVFCVPIWPEMYRWRKRATQFIKSVRKVVQILILLTLYPKGQSLVSCSVWLCRQGPGSHQQRYWVPWPAIKQKCIAAFWKIFYFESDNQQPIHLRVSLFNPARRSQLSMIIQLDTEVTKILWVPLALVYAYNCCNCSIPASRRDIPSHCAAAKCSSVGVWYTVDILRSALFSLFFPFSFQDFHYIPLLECTYVHNGGALLLAVLCVHGIIAAALFCFFKLCAGWRVRNNNRFILYKLVSCAPDEK